MGFLGGGVGAGFVPAPVRGKFLSICLTTVWIVSGYEETRLPA